MGGKWRETEVRREKTEVRRVKSDVGLYGCLNLYCEHGEHEGEALAALLPEGATQAPVIDRTKLGKKEWKPVCHEEAFFCGNEFVAANRY
jgi:hypothetical protein